MLLKGSATQFKSHNALSSKSKHFFHHQVAAEHNSAEATRVLLDEGASAGVKDNSGMSALALLISKMPVVVGKITTKN